MAETDMPQTGTQQDNASALNSLHLGLRFLNEENLREAAVHLEAAAVLGLAEGQRRLGTLLLQKGERFEAAQWTLRAAKQGDLEAQACLAALYESGWGVPSNIVKAAKWYRRAADRGHAKSQGVLGTYYEEGWGVPRDVSLAALYYRKAAMQGLATAQCDLGRLYERGDGVPKSLSAARRFYHLAAEQGDADAMFFLGRLHHTEGTNFTAAVQWCRMAADFGSTEAEGLLPALLMERRNRD
mmetsp:Transcript_13861/g.35377  ORF Transcript_13861/g.35377 Transcript_13861/m.35377 type:complete len:241 (-) Transcript_13861:48-770(-)|eukprot:CAMPEP_0177629324 /NCGR_PEP_ID=MMETSP0447-20121125/607_1 /TAXON_ID=0 /ORGANISM="Stygamoeba regulata, Strain BSH-02190019" /LENGTH=240 /DNA_ID=CAMNT_0019130637 /DNA_START=128 /DNA_END=850 /DNA_ORIENTATION=+